MLSSFHGPPRPSHSFVTRWAGVFTARVTLFAAVSGVFQRVASPGVLDNAIIWFPCTDQGRTSENARKASESDGLRWIRRGAWPPRYFPSAMALARVLSAYFINAGREQRRRNVVPP